ncbi:MAG: O-antigen ligase family protein [Verrucomicrobiota bacterium]|nr:O-antigen ligase family protein [Limisphaera sp.]MDW8382666.1 O-antigen ligase family protein [Verrucomicrobiota bacterium]
MQAAPDAARERPVSGALRAALWHARLDRLSGVILCASVVFAPWALGGTPSWARLVLKVVGYTLGLLWFLKKLIRRKWRYTPPRWETECERFGHAGWFGHAWSRVLGILTVATLTYAAVAAWNARAIYEPDFGTFAYRPYIPWLPHSYDAHSSWETFTMALAMACFFWSARDWMLGQNLHDRRWIRRLRPRSDTGLILPHRLRALLWVISLNGALLSAEAIVQRWSETDRLLWLVRPRHNAVAEAQLGPFNYRSNGAQYLNLIWPVTLGLWWRLHQMDRAGSPSALRSITRRSCRVHHLLLPAAGLMAATSVLSLSRGGAAVAVGSMLVCTGIFWTGWRHRRPAVRMGLLAFWGCAMTLALWISGPSLEQRLEVLDDGMVQREQMYETGRAIAQDYPWFGTGPGTLGTVFQLYRKSPEDYWPAQLHNDWLEYRVTWGRVGLALILLAFGMIWLRYFLPGGVITSWRLWLFYAVALGGCLVHARWDFPLQIPSIQHLVTIHCAALSLFSHPHWAGHSGRLR